MSTTNINLLPWREELKQKRQKRVRNAIIFFWFLAAGFSFLMVKYWDDRIDFQNSRNQFLEGEIAKLNDTIKEIEELKAKRNAIVDRMEVIQELQSDRAQIVHIFDDLVQKLPEGVFFDSLTKKGRTIDMKGFAQANARVSSLMKNLDASSWFQSPELKIVKNTAQSGLEVSQFDLKVSQENSRSEGEK